MKKVLIWKVKINNEKYLFIVKFVLDFFSVLNSGSNLGGQRIYMHK